VPGERLGTQPQRDVLRLHRLPHHRYKLAIWRLQVGLVTEPGRERLQSLSGVVLSAVEAPVYERLDAPTQWAEQCSNYEGGDHDG
jgi:hypothetical protein